MSEVAGYGSTTFEDFQITSTEGTGEEILANLKGEEAKPDDPRQTPEEAEAKETSAAAARLGKKGGEASAKAKEKAAKESQHKETRGDRKDEAGGLDAEASGDVHKDASADSERDEQSESDKRRHDPETRIRQLAKDRAEARAALDKLTEEVRQLRAERQPKPEEKQATEPDLRPRRSQFATEDEWADAVFKYSEERAEKREAARREQDAAVQTIKSKVETFNKRLTASARQALADRAHGLWELQASWQLPPNTQLKAVNVIADEVLESESMSELIDHFYDNPDDLESLKELPNARAIVRAVHALELQLSKQPETKEAVPKPAERSRAAPPPRPLPSATATDDDEDDDDMDIDKHIKVYNARDKRERSKR